MSDSQNETSVCPFCRADVRSLRDLLPGHQLFVQILVFWCLVGWKKSVAGLGAWSLLPQPHPPGGGNGGEGPTGGWSGQLEEICSGTTDPWSLEHPSLLGELATRTNSFQGCTPGGGCCGGWPGAGPGRQGSAEAGLGWVPRQGGASQGSRSHPSIHHLFIHQICTDAWPGCPDTHDQTETALPSWGL